MEIMVNKIIYLDNASTTKVNPEVLNTYNKCKELYFGNASSIHLLGQEASRLLEKARSQILNTLGLNDHEVIFTSGATEGNNLAIKGYCLKFQNRGKHIIVSNVEHASVLEVAKQLESYFGFEVTYLPVNSKGVIELETLKSAIRKDTILVSIMAVNNEIGAMNPIHEIAELLKKYPLIAFHVDATQAFGKIKIPYQEIDMFTFSGHKIHCLNSSGALIKRKKIELLPLFSGGGQENDFRSGTLDVAMDVSLAKGIRLIFSQIDEHYKSIKPLADTLLTYLKNNPTLYEINSNEDNPYIVNFSLLTKKASVIVESLSNQHIMVSSTSACHAHEEPMSYVVKAMGKSDLLSHNTIRVSFSYENTIDDVNTFTGILDKTVKELK